MYKPILFVECKSGYFIKTRDRSTNKKKDKMWFKLYVITYPFERQLNGNRFVLVVTIFSS